jgi:hypothetical protein
MMRHLLHVDFGTIIMSTLVSLPKYRVKRFIEPMARVEEGKRSGHHELHTLDRFSGDSRCVHVQGGVKRHCSDHIEQ